MHGSSLERWNRGGNTAISAQSRQHVPLPRAVRANKSPPLPYSRSPGMCRTAAAALSAIRRDQQHILALTLFALSSQRPPLDTLWRGSITRRSEAYVGLQANSLTRPHQNSTASDKAETSRRPHLDGCCCSFCRTCRWRPSIAVPLCYETWWSEAPMPLWIACASESVTEWQLQTLVRGMRSSKPACRGP